MKKLIVVLAMFPMFIGIGCREEKTEKVIIEKQVEVPKPKETDGTSLKIDKEGIAFSTKNGKKKTEIIVE